MPDRAVVEHHFEDAPSPVDPVEIMAQIWGAPSTQEAAQEAAQEANHLMALFLAAGLTPDQIVEYLQHAPWRQAPEGRGA